jgi:carbonic anhydrase
MRTLTKEIQENITPELAIELLANGNQRFIQNLKVNRDLLKQVNETSDGQHPFAVILSCIDSRTSAELIFDQGLGDVFSIRIAGNVVNEDILGSMEFSCKIAGAKLIVVLGHSKCGAIKGACEGVKLENLTALLDKIRPSIEIEKKKISGSIDSPEIFYEKVAKKNVEFVIQNTLSNSSTLSQMVKSNEIAIVGAMYDVRSGKVEFFKGQPDSRILEYYMDQTT